MLPDSFDGKSACCFTGHRPAGLPGGGDEASLEMLRLKALLVRAVRDALDRGIHTFLAGGAAGFDLLAEETVLAWKTAYPNARLVLALPSRTFLARQNAQVRARAAQVLLQTDETVYATENDNTFNGMYKRNRYLVEHAECCIAYLTRQDGGGTLYTANYALERGLPLFNIAQIDKN